MRTLLAAALAGSALLTGAAGSSAHVEVLPATSSGGSSGAAIWLGVIAIGLGALACVAVGLLWSSRPMPLPGDDDPPPS